MLSHPRGELGLSALDGVRKVVAPAHGLMEGPVGLLALHRAEPRLVASTALEQVLRQYENSFPKKRTKRPKEKKVSRFSRTEIERERESESRAGGMQLLTCVAPQFMHALLVNTPPSATPPGPDLA